MGAGWPWSCLFEALVAQETGQSDTAQYMCMEVCAGRRVQGAPGAGTNAAWLGLQVRGTCEGGSEQWLPRERGRALLSQGGMTCALPLALSWNRQVPLGTQRGMQL